MHTAEVMTIIRACSLIYTVLSTCNRSQPHLVNPSHQPLDSPHTTNQCSVLWHMM